MGFLIDGKWHSAWSNTSSEDGAFKRSAAQFRNWITPDGSAGPSGQASFAAEPDRYHLYVSLACPWAHRTLIFRQLKSLKPMIGVSTVHWLMREDGWTFDEGPGVVPDDLLGTSRVHEIYTRADPGYSGRVTVPILWDKKTATIVSNESSEIIRMLGSAFDGVGASPGDYYPMALRAEIDSVNERVYETVNNGVYRAGFASSQEAYENAVGALFETLDWLEKRLSTSRYLIGQQLTEADWRLFTTLVRFDAVYVGHFKCNRKRIADYPNLSGFLRDLYQRPGIAGTVSMLHIKSHYYASHTHINPTGIVPVGPDDDLTLPHDRASLG